MVAAMIAASAIAHGRNGGTGIKPINKRAANAPLDLIVVRIDVVYIEARSKLSRTIEFCVMQAQRCSLPGEYRMGTFDSSVPVAVQRERVSRREIDVAGESRSGPAGCRAPAARSQSGHLRPFNNDVARTMECRLHSDSGPSPDPHPGGSSAGGAYRAPASAAVRC